MRFVYLLPLSLLLSSPALAVRARPAGVYQHCNSVWAESAAGYGLFMPRIGENGGLLFDPKESSVQSFERSPDGNSETVTVVFNGVYPGAKPVRSKYVLTRRDGKPETLEQVYDPSTLIAFDSKAPKMDRTVTRFGFENGKCFVKESAVRFRNGQESVFYHHEACADVLAAAKGFNRAKLNECVEFMTKVEGALGKHETSVKGKNRELNLSFMGMISPSVRKTDSAFIGSLKPIMAVAACVMGRQGYGLSVDPGVQGLGLGGGMGGGTGFPGTSGQPRSGDRAPESGTAE